MEVLLRPWRLSDAENLAQLANNPNIAKNLMNQFSNWLSEAVNFQQREQREDVDPVSEFERMRG